MFCWNDIIWPLIVIFDNARHPISLGVLSCSNAYNTDYGATFVGYVMASIPLVMAFALTAQRFMAGLQGGTHL